jgi:hypothetical protein
VHRELISDRFADRLSRWRMAPIPVTFPIKNDGAPGSLAFGDRGDHYLNPGETDLVSS